MTHASTYKYDFNNPSNEMLEKNKEIESTSVTLGSTDPSDLLEEPLSTFFESVFER